MTYVLSDLHGQYEKYRRMLEHIHFSDDDELYVLGDVVDRGPSPARILLNMSMRPNVFPILGNHDRMALPLLRQLCVEIMEENVESQLDMATLRSLKFWQSQGGDTTIEDFQRLSQDTRLALLDYMDDFAPYEMLRVNGNRFLLVHGGIPWKMRHLSPEEIPLDVLLTERMSYHQRYYDHTYLVSGHTPTVFIGKEYEGRIYQDNGHIAIDCGATFNLPLGCIRLDDFAEFYVE